METHFVDVGEVTLHVKAFGDPENPLMVLLHGFPEFWYGWDPIVDHLTTAGYYLLIPDQRGYNLSSKPWQIGKYMVHKLANDVIGLIDWAGQADAVVCGHDWGAAVTWAVALNHPERISKAVIVNVPHFSAITKALLTNRKQRRKSWYMFFFQVPWLPQWSLTRNDKKMLIESLEKTSIPGTFTDSDLDMYKEAWSQPGSVSKMINWYRAAARRRVKLKQKIVTIPLRIIWGERDRFLEKSLAEDSLQYCDNADLKYIANGTHWVIREKPDEVAELILEFVS